MDHPYSTLPARAFWSRAVSRDFAADDVSTRGQLLVCRGEKVVSAGSCFASNLVPYLEGAGFTYLRTETVHPSFRDIPPENLGYGKFSAGYGNIYTVRQLLQLVRRALGAFRPVEDRWRVADAVIDPFRPGLRYKARSDREFDLLTQKHLAAVRAAFTQADVFIFTLGLTEGWVSRLDGAVFPACPGTVAGDYDPQKHAFHNFGVAEIASDLDELVAELRSINPRLRFVLTVSPVPLVATASGEHVLAATTYSKSVLRVAAEQAVRNNPGVSYFPAYEIVTGPQAPREFFEPDRRNVSKAAVDVAMAAFLANCQGTAVASETAQEVPAAAASAAAAAVAPENANGGPRASSPHADENGAEAKPAETKSAEVKPPGAEPPARPAEAGDLAGELGRYIAAAECEEVMADRRSYG